MKKIVVTGGNGFIGSEVCRRALAAGYATVGVARGGRPDGAGAWAERVEWIAADVLQPEAWRGALDGATAIVHCIGIIREHPGRGVTFERVNGDAAIVVADTAVDAGVGSFVFLSAAEGIPLVSREYLRAKRRAEREIAALPLRSAFLRPGFVYGPGRRASYLPAALMTVARAVPFVAAWVHPMRALPVGVVARAALRAATEPGIAGVVDTDAIERLGKEP